MEDVHGPLLVCSEGDVPADHDALRDRWVAGEAELCRHCALMHLTRARERRLFAVDCDRPVGDGSILECTSHERRRDDRPAVVCEGDCAGIGKLSHLGELAARRALRDRCEEADRYHCLRLRKLDERAEDGCGVDDGIGVGHGEDGAIATGSSRLRSRCDRLLVLTTRRAQMHVRVDERRREDEPCGVDDPMAVGLDVVAELGDHAVVHPDVEQRVDATRRIEDARPANDEIVLRRVLHMEDRHHATSSSSVASTETGPCVSRS